MAEWSIETDHSFKCPPNESAEIVSDVSRFAIISDGSLYLMKHRKVVPPLEFCVDTQLGKGEGRVVKSCFSRQELCGDGSSCVRKCCPDASFVDERSSRCTRSNLSDTYNFRRENWTVIHEKPDCQFGHSLIAINGTFSVSSEDLSLVTPDFTVPFLQYCLDHFTNLQYHEKDEPGDTPVVKVLMCFNQTQPDVFDPRGLQSVSVGFATIMGIALLLSAAAIAIAALVSWRLPELRSLHGKCQLSHLATLFCLFICLAIVQLGREHIPMGMCKFFAVLIHTCALSSFLWLNLLCFNIYMTFRSLRPPLAARRDENRRLFFLCIYAWGIPASFVAFLFVLDSQDGRLEPMPRPDYGVLKCLMSSRDAEFAYLFGPVGVLLLINGLLFCLTAQELLCGLWRLDNSDSITFRRKSMGLVVAKLGIVMGMGWILDVLSWGFGRKFPFLFYAGDVFNALQGVFICVVLLWRKRVLEVLHLRKPSITKDETLTVRPFLPKNGVNNACSHTDNDTSLVIVQDQ
ncbi:unnamed protein product [Orchesella dallaii]|uniref:G-protein coupled receptors family 2 profile 2 domain-containing protein n=1 Tax=Orchesella dallaii TaxID=48710 RepID=A0ABP1S607_9HEXA